MHHNMLGKGNVRPKLYDGAKLSFGYEFLASRYEFRKTDFRVNTGESSLLKIVLCKKRCLLKIVLSKKGDSLSFKFFFFFFLSHLRVSLFMAFTK